MGIVVSRVLSASPERVWGVLVSWERQGEWMPLTRVRVVGEAGAGRCGGVGTRLIAVTGVGPLRVVDPMTVTEWVPFRRCVVHHEGRLLKGSAVFSLDGLGAERCRLTWREDIRLPAPIAVFARPFFALALRRLARLVE